jgi:hypothetical protein
MATGKGAYLALDEDTAAVSPTNISAWIRRIESTNNPENVDATVLTSTMIEREATFEENTLRVTFKWSPAVITFLESVKADPNGLNYEYGPQGNAAGKHKISGTCNAISTPTIPGSDPRALTELTIELSLVTAVHATFA